MAEQLVGVLKYAPGDFFGEFEAISLSGSRAVPAGGEPLGEYLTTGGIATATIRAAERCELLRISTAADVRLFHTCLNSSTLKLLDQLCTVGQYASVEEDALARLAVFGRERWMKRGEVVFVDGASPEYVVMVLQGQLKVRSLLAYDIHPHETHQVNRTKQIYECCVIQWTGHDLCLCRLSQHPRELSDRQHFKFYFRAPWWVRLR